LLFELQMYLHLWHPMKISELKHFGIHSVTSKSFNSKYKFNDQYAKITLHEMSFSKTTRSAIHKTGYMLSFSKEFIPRQKCPYFDVVIGFGWSDDRESYAGGSITTGRGSHAGQVKGDDPRKKGYPGAPGWGLRVGLTNPPCKSWICLETSTEAS
jgi:hypothetical protein